jgi:hypothetical protein
MLILLVLWVEPVVVIASINLNSAVLRQAWPCPELLLSMAFLKRSTFSLDEGIDMLDIPNRLILVSVPATSANHNQHHHRHHLHQGGV